MCTIKIKNKLRNIAPVYMGDEAFPVIVSNVGISNLDDSLDIEKEKINRAISVGANMIADLSMIGDIASIQSQLLENLSVPFSVVAAYEIYTLVKENGLLTSQDVFLRIVENEMKRGVDMITLHATVLKDDIKLIQESDRIITSTSRGGTMILEILQKNGFENPFYVYFDDILKMASKYSVCISLGPCYRPGSVCDSYIDEPLHNIEINRMAELAKRAQEYNVGLAIEGIGHAPLNVIPEIVRKTKEICNNAPYRVLTVATDIALGYDHIASAIASSSAVLNGANSITCVTRAEHIGLPTIDDIEEAVISSKTAAYCGYIARTGDFSKDREMSLARHLYGCNGNTEIALYPTGARIAEEKYKYTRINKDCSMCGEFCALNTSDRLSKK